MKRIILGLSVLLMLAQNGFARDYTNAELDVKIAEQRTELDKQAWRCNKAMAPQNSNHSNVNDCLKAIKMGKANGYSEKDMSWLFLNAGVIYRYSNKDYIKAYEYYMKAAKLGETMAQTNLDSLCRKHSWVCK